MFHNRDDTNIGLAVPSAEVENILQIADTNVASDTRVVEVDIDREVLS